MSDELDKLRKERMKELKEAANDQSDQQELAKKQQQAEKEREERKQAILRKIMTDKAKERLTNIKLVKPNLANNIENQLISLAQSGRLQGGKINEDQFKRLLKQLQDKKRDSSITFKRV